MRNMSKEFIKWKNSPENNRAPGLSCLKGISNLELGKDWKYSGVNSEGCGAAMRTAPIGLVYHDNLGKLKEIALNSAIITHNNPVAIASAVANAYLVARAINNEPKENALEDLIRFTQGVSDKFTNKILQVEELLDLQPERAIPFLGEGWTGHEAIAIALCSCIKSDFDFEKSIITAANITGDSDSTASIAGGIAGAYCGLSGIPDKFYKELENSELLRKVAEELYLK
jgi:ADP-ribosylglycohydrolase